MEPPKIFISGYLKVSSFKTNWTIRYFEQNQENPSQLEYFESEGKSVKKGTIDLLQLYEIQVGKTSTFSLISNQKNINLKLIPLGVNVPRKEFQYWTNALAQWLDYFTESGLSNINKPNGGWIKEKEKQNLLESFFSSSTPKNSPPISQKSIKNKSDQGSFIQEKNPSPQEKNPSPQEKPRLEQQSSDKKAPSSTTSQKGSPITSQKGSPITSRKSEKILSSFSPPPEKPTKEKSLIDSFFPQNSSKPPSTTRSFSSKWNTKIFTSKETSREIKETSREIKETSREIKETTTNTDSPQSNNNLQNFKQKVKKTISRTLSAGHNLQTFQEKLKAFTQIPQRNTPEVEELAKLLKSDWGQKDIPWDEIEQLSDIGKGNFGVVTLGLWRNTKIAIKQIRTEHLNEKGKEAFLSEINIMRSLRPHPNIAQFIGLCYEPLSLITLYYGNGSLHQFLKAQGESLKLLEKVRIMKGIAVGVDHLHKEKLIHRDLAARNILLDENFVPIVSDFGLGRYLANKEEGTTENLSGAIRWMAMECFSGDQARLSFSVMTDMWSFGVTCWEIITNCLTVPYHEFNNFQIPLLLSEGKRLSFPSYTPKWLLEPLTKTWSVDPTKRPSFQTLIEILDKKINELQETVPSKTILFTPPDDQIYALTPTLNSDKSNNSNSNKNDIPSETSVNNNNNNDTDKKTKGRKELTSSHESAFRLPRRLSQGALAPFLRDKEQNIPYKQRRASQGPMSQGPPPNFEHPPPNSNEKKTIYRSHSTLVNQRKSTDLSDLTKPPPPNTPKPPIQRSNSKNLLKPQENVIYNTNH